MTNQRFIQEVALFAIYLLPAGRLLRVRELYHAIYKAFPEECESISSAQFETCYKEPKYKNVTRFARLEAEKKGLLVKRAHDLWERTSQEPFGARSAVLRSVLA